MKPKTHKPPKGMKRIKRFSLQAVLPHIGKVERKFWAGRVYRVRLSSQRDLLIGRTQTCACCGLKGTYFWLEHSGCRPPHFNLYGINKNGNEVMLTADHIKPRSKGGKTEQANFQLLCKHCNKAKRNDEITLEELRQRRGLKDAKPTASRVARRKRTHSSGSGQSNGSEPKLCGENGSEK